MADAEYPYPVEGLSEGGAIVDLAGGKSKDIQSVSAMNPASTA